MKRTAPPTIIVLVLIGTGLGWLTELALVATGNRMVVPPITLSIALIVTGFAVVVLALPVRRAVRGKKGAKRVDPFYAIRVVALAKASSITGALLLGFGVGVILFLGSRPVVAGAGAVGLTITEVVGAAVILSGGLIAEFLCVLPPDDDEKANDKAPELPPSPA